jgi:hypothetical protein
VTTQATDDGPQPDQLADFVKGPNGYWDEDRPVTRGQKADIGEAFCALAGIPYPRNRLEATVLLLRLVHAQRHDHKLEVPEIPF